MTKQYAVSFDPGYKNLGMAIIDLKSWNGKGWKGEMHLIDLTVHNGVSYQVKDLDYGTIIYDLIRSMEDVFKNTIIVGIELQPNYGTRLVHAIQCHLESAIRGMNPNIHIYLISGKSVRLYWGTHGQTYTLRKLASMTSQMLNTQDIFKVKKIFTRQIGLKSSFHVDAIEAMQICIFMIQNITKLNHISIDSQPRKYSFLSLKDCHLNLPNLDTQSKKINLLKKITKRKKKVGKS